MNIFKALATVIASTAIFGGLGLALGYQLGVLVPGYYRNVFRDGHTPQFDPIDMGIGLGITQGATAGMVIGVLLVLILAWHDTRRP